jgi:hypothetical protein
LTIPIHPPQLPLLFQACWKIASQRSSGAASKITGYRHCAAERVSRLIFLVMFYTIFIRTCFKTYPFANLNLLQNAKLVFLKRRILYQNGYTHMDAVYSTGRQCAAIDFRTHTDEIK